MLKIFVFLYVNLVKRIEIHNLTGNVIMTNELTEKIKILADAAKYDVSCSSSGTSRRNNGIGLGNAVSSGICHSFTEDGRCISLLKILLSNYCIYDCAYCVNRRGNDIQRATFTVKEIAELTINFYRRNYIEGLFLSSGVLNNPDYTMERLARVAKTLRNEYRYNGYIHLKAIPGASENLLYEAGLYADRLSVNIEIPAEKSLKVLAPEKDFISIFKPMGYIKNGIAASKEDRRKYKKAPVFTPAGQSTQLIVGASPEKDIQILQLASTLYKGHQLKRVYYSGYIPVSLNDKRLPAINQPPLVRENRLYQADWLLRFYKFKVNEIVNDAYPDLDLEIDPKLSYALRNPSIFPVDINKADFDMILRVPGIGVRSAQLIISARRYGRLTYTHLKKMGVVLKRAQYFITCNELPLYTRGLSPEKLKRQLLLGGEKQKKKIADTQLKLF